MIATTNMIVGRIYADCNPDPNFDTIITYLMYVGRTRNDTPGEDSLNFIMMAGCKSYVDIGELVTFHNYLHWYAPSKKKLKEIFGNNV